MNRNQFINNICGINSKNVQTLKSNIQNEIKKKNEATSAIYLDNRLKISITDYSVSSEGTLELTYKVYNKTDGNIKPLIYTYSYEVPSNIMVELPKVLLSIMYDFAEVEFLCHYKKFFFFKRPVICTFEVSKSVIDRIKKENIEYNTGMSTKNKTKKIDIRQFALRDKKNIESKYIELLKILTSKSIDFRKELLISDLNTITYKTDLGTFHLAYSSLLLEENFDYKIIYDSNEGTETKKPALNYLYSTIQGKPDDLAIVVSMLETLD